MNAEEYDRRTKEFVKIAEEEKKIEEKLRQIINVSPQDCYSQSCLCQPSFHQHGMRTNGSCNCVSLRGEDQKARLAIRFWQGEAIRLAKLLIEEREK